MLGHTYKGVNGWVLSDTQGGQREAVHYRYKLILPLISVWCSHAMVVASEHEQ